MVAKIIQKENPILRQRATPVPVDEITSPKIQKIIAEMKVALAGEKDGVAIAAPQIGEPLRIFVVSSFILKTADKKYEDLTDDLVFINPKITKLSKKKEWLEEGCLSVRWLYGKVSRSTKASIRAYNERGESFERGASGLLAQIFQHETDHLEGVLFIDTAENIEEVLPEEMEKRIEKDMDKEIKGEVKKSNKSNA